MGGFSLAALGAATATAVAAALLAHPSTRRHLLSRSARQDATTSQSRLARWLGMWEAGRTNFHQTEPHPILARYMDVLLGNSSDKPRRVFVPLCGKTVDLPWLAQQSSVAAVIGNEAAEMAVGQFAKEHPSLKMATKGEVIQEPEAPGEHASFTVHSSSDRKVTLLQGDHFFLGPNTLGEVDCVWDRAALIAVNPPARSLYVDVLKAVLKPGGKILLSTLDRAAGTKEARQKGPPFSLPEAEVKRLFGKWCTIEKLESTDLLAEEGGEWDRFRDQGLTSLLEEAYILTKTTA